MTPSAPAFAIARACAGLLTPNPTATGTGDTALTSRTRRPTDEGRRRAGTGHADERHAVQEAAAARRDGRSPGRRRGRGHQVHDREAHRARDGLERRALVRREVSDDQPGRTGSGQATRHGLAVPTADDLVRVAHRDEREVRPGGTDALDEPKRTLERGPGP